MSRSSRQGHRQLHFSWVRSAEVMSPGCCDSTHRGTQGGWPPPNAQRELHPCSWAVWQPGTHVPSCAGWEKVSQSTFKLRWREGGNVGSDGCVHTRTVSSLPLKKYRHHILREWVGQEHCPWALHDGWVRWITWLWAAQIYTRLGSFGY